MIEKWRKFFKENPEAEIRFSVNSKGIWQGGRVFGRTVSAKTLALLNKTPNYDYVACGWYA